MKWYRQRYVNAHEFFDLSPLVTHPSFPYHVLQTEIFVGGEEESGDYGLKLDNAVELQQDTVDVSALLHCLLILLRKLFLTFASWQYLTSGVE